MKQKPTKEQLYNLYWKEGKTLRQIATHFNCSYCKVCYWIGKYKIKIRTSSEARKGKYLGKNCHRWKEKIKIKCKQCKIVFEVIPSRKNRAKFCSIDCKVNSQKEKVRSKESNQKTSKTLKGRKHKDPNCQCAFCKTRRGEMKGKNCPNYGKTGKNNLNYIDGRTPLNMLIRNSLEYKQWRTKNFQRDNYTCQECNKRSRKGGRIYLEVHHKKWFNTILSEFLKRHNNLDPIKDKYELVELSKDWKEFWDVNNGITLCKKCHNKIRRNYAKCGSSSYIK